MTGSDWLWRTSDFLKGLVDKSPMTNETMQAMGTGYGIGACSALALVYWVSIRKGRR